MEIVFYFAIRSVGYSNFLTKMLYILRFCTIFASQLFFYFMTMGCVSALYGRNVWAGV